MFFLNVMNDEAAYLKVTSLCSSMQRRVALVIWRVWVLEVLKDELKCVEVPSVCCVVQWRLSLNVFGVLESFMKVLNVLHDESAHLQVSIFCGQV